MTQAQRKREPVLIANRGEIAIRIARTCRTLGFPTVSVYSDADRFAEHTRLCDQAYWIGGAAPKESYLNVERVIATAKTAGARYVHPGYGFLSERPHFVEACQKAGLVFVGPSSESMKLMGDKIQARATVDGLKIPSVPGSTGAVANASEAARVAREIGYPVLLKATAGGGGKGMRRVEGESELNSAFEGASREALSAFGDGEMYVEKYILDPHHVEIQVFGDGSGGAIHLGERECSIQRRHQKVWEESPSPILNQFPKTREAMFEAAVRIAKHVRYAGAGTFEFIVDGNGNFYFLEMNTRLQVEHPVTEWVTGVDLVAWQLLLAAGELKLPEIPIRRGSAIEVRLYAEDPYSFLPAPGALGLIHLPAGPFTRTDSALNEAGVISVHYDPMIAKISVWGQTRDEAMDRLCVALDEARVEPPKQAQGVRVGSLKTNLPFLRRLARNSTVRSGNTTTDLIVQNPELTENQISREQAPTLPAAIALSLFQLIEESELSLEGASGDSMIRPSVWALKAKQEGVRS
jgi:acetyl-CoA carboxylase, biotin carboxylase subunit